jgi:predicted transglutaminase-like cysteine proteinase
MRTLASLILACLAPLAATAAAATEVAAPMPIAGPAHAPMGYVEMCRRHPAECGSDATSQVATTDIATTGPAAIGNGASARVSREQWADIFAIGRAKVSEAPSSISPAPTMGRPRLPMASRSWMHFSDEPAPQPSYAREFRPFWNGDGRISASADASGPWRTLQLRLDRPAPVVVAPPAVVAEDAGAEAPIVPNAVAPEAFTDMRTLRTVNSQINRSIRRASDRQTFGREDFWAVPEDGATSGDCEDYVLAKRHALVAAGVPSAALSIALVRTRQGEMHAVLLVATENGEVVLDNLSPWVLPWAEAPYAWLDRQAAGTGKWVRVAA